MGKGAEVPKAPGEGPDFAQYQTRLGGLDSVAARLYKQQYGDVRRNNRNFFGTMGRTGRANERAYDQGLGHLTDTWSGVSEDLVAGRDRARADAGRSAGAIEGATDRAIGDLRDTRGEVGALGGRFSGMMGDEYGRAQALGRRQEEVFRPLEDEFIQDARSYNTLQRQDVNAGRAMADVNPQFAAQRQAAQDRLASFGIDPSQLSSGALDLSARVSQAAAAAGAGTAARERTEETGRQLRGQAIEMGRYTAQDREAAVGNAGNLGQMALGAQGMAGELGQAAGQLGISGYGTAAGTRLGAEQFGLAGNQALMSGEGAIADWRLAGRTNLSNASTNNRASMAGISLQGMQQPYTNLNFRTGLIDQQAGLDQQSYDNEMARFNAKMQRFSAKQSSGGGGMFSSLGSMAGTALGGFGGQFAGQLGGNLADKMIFGQSGGYQDPYAGRHAFGGPIEGAIPDRTGRRDDVPIQASDGEFMIPRSVVMRKGTEFFERLIQQFGDPGDIEASRARQAIPVN